MNVHLVCSYQTLKSEPAWPESHEDDELHCDGEVTDPCNPRVQPRKGWQDRVGDQDELAEDREPKHQGLVNVGDVGLHDAETGPVRELTHVETGHVRARECTHRRADVSGSATRMILPRNVRTSIRRLFKEAELRVLVEWRLGRSVRTASRICAWRRHAGCRTGQVCQRVLELFLSFPVIALAPTVTVSSLKMMNFIVTVSHGSWQPAKLPLEG